MSFETEVIDRLSRVETKVNNIEKQFHSLRNTAITISGAAVISIATLVAHIML